MNTHRATVAVIFLMGVASGIGIAHFSSARAADEGPSTDLSTRKFRVFIDEVKQNFVFGDQFAGHYSKVVTLSDGKQRTIELTPMVHNGMQVVEFKDTGFHSYMSLSGTTTNGDLMVQVVDDAERHSELKAQGWKLPLWLTTRWSGP